MQFCQRCEPMILKMRVKFVLWQPRYCNLLTEKSKKIYAFDAFLNLKKFSLNSVFRWYRFGKFYIVKFNYFSGRPYMVKERFWNIFDWALCEWYLKQSYCWYVFKDTCISVIRPILCGLVHTRCHSYNSLVHAMYVLFI